MLRFTREMAVGRREGRWDGRLCSAMAGSDWFSPHCNGGAEVCRAVLLGMQLQIAGGRVMVGSRWQWVADGQMVGPCYWECSCRLPDRVQWVAGGGAMVEW